MGWVTYSSSRLKVPIICEGIPGHHPLFFNLSLFFSLCLPTFLVSLSVFCARKSCLLESLFLDKNSNQIDSLILNHIIFILCNGSSIGWVAVAVANASGVDGRFCCSGGSIGRGGGGCSGGSAAVWWLDFGGGLMMVPPPPTGRWRGGGATPPPLTSAAVIPP